MEILPDNVHVLPQNAAVRTLMTVLRDADTPSDRFRAAARRLAPLIAAEAVNEEPAERFDLRTPLEVTDGYRFRRGAAMLVPVRRAGGAFEEAFCHLLPNPHICEIGLSRDHVTLQPSEYSCKVPERFPDEVYTAYVLDPMLATGGSAAYAVELLKRRGARRVVFVGVVGAPEGVGLLHERHPDVPVYLAALDRELNERGYILPGLGDFGDRLNNSF